VWMHDMDAQPPETAQGEGRVFGELTPFGGEALRRHTHVPRWRAQSRELNVALGVRESTVRQRIDVFDQYRRLFDACACLVHDAHVQERRGAQANTSLARSIQQGELGRGAPMTGYFGDQPENTARKPGKMRGPVALGAPPTSPEKLVAVAPEGHDGHASKGATLGGFGDDRQLGIAQRPG